jgi:hypothetical protein
VHSELEKEIEDQKSNINFKKEIEFINQNQKAKSLLNLAFRNKDITLYESMLTRFYGKRILKTLLTYRLLSLTHIDKEVNRVEITGLGAWILTQQH